jgi:hypothetical protein
MAITSPGMTVRIASTQARKQRSNACGCTTLNTRPTVSYEGIPLGSAKHCSNQGRLVRPNSAISVQPLAPHSTPAMAVTIRSIS